MLPMPLVWQLLWALDNGKAVGLEGLSDPELRQQLVQLLAKLHLKETKVRAGISTTGSALLVWCCYVGKLEELE